MNIPCALVLRGCDCTGNPIVGISAEEKDFDAFIGVYDFPGQPPLGTSFAQISCKAVCFSADSQQDADLCALLNAQRCAVSTWQQPDIGASHAPGGIPPSQPMVPMMLFYNSRQTCTVSCPDGNVSSATIDAGTVAALSQSLANAQAQSLACNLALAQRICFTSNADLPGSQSGLPYKFQLTATSTGGGSFVWKIISGSLPPGLFMDSNGLITGTPTVPGNYSFTVSITDPNGRVAYQTFAICIIEIITASPLPHGTLGQSYSQVLTEIPAPPPTEMWSIVSGSLPPGISLQANGTLTGTPTASGQYSFVVQVAANCFTVCMMTITTDSSLPHGYKGQAYNTSLHQTPAAPVTEVWSVISGALPPGLTLNTNGGINGTPTTVGVYTFTAQVIADC